MINGIDASWGVVEGEFGLDRPGVVAPTVIYRPLQVSVPYSEPGYFPRSDRKPGYGRLEIVPPPDAPKPPPAPSYFRSWSSQSQPGPVTDYAPYPAPPIVYAPTIEGNHGQKGHHHQSLNSTSSAGRTWPVFIRLLIGAASEGVSCRSIVLSLWHSPRSSRSACRRRRSLSAAATKPRRRSITPPRAVAAAAVNRLRSGLCTDRLRRLRRSLCRAGLCSGRLRHVWRNSLRSDRLCNADRGGADLGRLRLRHVRHAVCGGHVRSACCADADLRLRRLRLVGGLHPTGAALCHEPRSGFYWPGRHGAV